AKLTCIQYLHQCHVPLCKKPLRSCPNRRGCHDDTTGLSLDQRLTSLAGKAAMTSTALSNRHTAKNHKAACAVPVKSVAQPISELLTRPAILAIEQARAKPVAAAVPFRKVAGRLKKTGTAPSKAHEAIVKVTTVRIRVLEKNVLQVRAMAPTVRGMAKCQRRSR